MSRKKKLSEESQAAFEQEQANRPINPTGEGEAEAVKTLLSPEFEKMSNFDATDVALILQQILRGQESMLANVKDQGIQIAKLREHQAKADEQIAQMLDREKRGITEVLDKADRQRATGDELDRIKANAARQYTKAINEAKAQQSLSKLQFVKALEAQPKETITSPGVLITVREGASLIPKVIPEEIRLKHLVWYLKPGVPTVVPQSVAEVWRERQRSKEETDARKEMLSKQQEQSKLATEWSKVEGSTAQGMPLA